MTKIIYVAEGNINEKSKLINELMGKELADYDLDFYAKIKDYKDRIYPLNKLSIPTISLVEAYQYNDKSIPEYESHTYDLVIYVITLKRFKFELEEIRNTYKPVIIVVRSDAESYEWVMKDFIKYAEKENLNWVFLKNRRRSYCESCQKYGIMLSNDGAKCAHCNKICDSKDYDEDRVQICPKCYKKVTPHFKTLEWKCENKTCVEYNINHKSYETFGHDILLSKIDKFFENEN